MPPFPYVYQHTFSNSYEASAQNLENGVLKMHRRIVSGDVEAYSSHLPPQEVDLEKEEDIVFKKGVLIQASGHTSVRLMRQV